MRRAHWLLFLSIEVNLVLWLVVIGQGISRHPQADMSWIFGRMDVDAAVVLLGVLLAAVVQHYAYYRLWKNASGTAGPS